MYQDVTYKFCERITWNQETRKCILRAFTDVAKSDGGSYFDSPKRMVDGSWPKIAFVCILRAIFYVVGW